MNPAANRITFFLEVSNGCWTLLALVLFGVCVAYLQHEIRARHAFSRWRWTSGMRIAIAIGTLALGDAITRAMIFIWRHFFEGGPFTDLQFSVLAVGTAISVGGFACAIRELSEPLYGRLPWMLTSVIVFLFVGWEVLTVPI